MYLMAEIGGIICPKGRCKQYVIDQAIDEFEVLRRQSCGRPC
jgi:hypothetical protein